MRGERREENGEVWYMMYTYTAAAADILYVVRVCAVPQMRIEYPQGGGLGLGGGG